MNARFALLPVLMALAACGGSSSDDDDAGGGGGGGGGNTRTGVFVDAPVQGLDFSTPTQDDVTSATGQFRFRSGETVAFSIGRLALGGAPGAATLSPFDLAGTTNINDNVVTNLAVLLQSLDVDAGPNIRIPDLAASVAPASLNFAQAPASFAADPAVLAFIRAATGDSARDPVPVAQARIHLLQALGLDDDGDGVPDASDDCPNTPAGTPVNAQGCPGGGGDPNLPPTADAGDDQEVTEGADVALAGTGADSDGTIASFAWQQVGEPAVELTGANTATPSFTAPAVNDETNLVFRLTVTDDDGATDTDLVGVIVGNAATPNFTGLAGACLDFGGPQAFCEVFATGEENIPDVLPLAADAAPRGHLQPAPAANLAPTPKTVDGSAADWGGTATLFSGNSRLDRGEHIYTDYLFDAYGADDGADAQRLQLLDPLAEAATRTARFDALFQAAGDQFGAPAPIGALDHYGDATDLASQADLSELRWAADATNVFLLARFSALTAADAVGAIVLLDTQPGPTAAAEIGFGTGLSTQRFDKAVLLTSAGATVRDLATGAEAALADAVVQVAPGADAPGARWQNSLEARLPAALFAAAGGTRVGVITGPRTEGGITPANVAYRSNEPVTIYNDKHQALALFAGNVDEFGETISIRNLARGASETFAIGPGYYERHFVSGENISSENLERVEDSARLQRYGLYAPSSPALNPGGEAPLTIWMHYRGGKAHSGAAWTPRLIKQLGEEQGNYIATPHARGTSTWYVSEAHQDFFEVFADVAGTAIAGNENLATPQTIAPLIRINPDRVYLAGYSMGGYSSYLFGLLYPDLFAGAYPTSGAVTQGAWTGVGPDDEICSAEAEDIPEVGNGNFCFIEANGSNANAQLNYRILENARHVPYVIHHGSNDELALTPGAERMGLRLLELGYRYDMTTFLGYEHYTQAIVDEWKDGAAYLNRFTRPRNPRQVTYKVSPALVHAVNTVTAEGVAFDFNPDGAYWVDGLVVRDANTDDPTQYGIIQAESEALAAPMILPTPRTGDGTSTPVFSPGGHSTPYVRHGLEWTELGALPTANAFNAQLTRLSAASFDLARMGLDLTQRADGLVESDGPLTLRLTQATVPLRAYVNGIERADAQQGTVITLALVAADFAGGSALIQLQPGAGGLVFGTPEVSDIVAACRALAPEVQPFCDSLERFEAELAANCATFGGTPEFCATTGGHLHGVIEACRANGGSTFCKLADAFLEGFASGCRGIPEAPREFCALLGHERIAEEEILAFEKSWTHRALGLQYELGAGLPFVDALFVSTHNSFNSTNANDPQTLSGSDANQRYSTVDQLRMGVRAIEIDVHWMPSAEGFRPTVCHGNAFHFGCTYEKSLEAELTEVRGWLDANPGQVVLIYLENNLNEPLDGSTGEISGSEPYAAAAQVIRDTLGNLVYTPADHGGSCGGGHPLTASVASLRLAGKQLYIQTEGCNAGWADLVFSQSAGNHDQGGDDSQLETFSVDGMCGGFTRDRHETRWTRYFEDGTLLGAATSMSDGSLTPPSAYVGMVRCGVNMPSMDHVTPSDPRLPAFVWSWQPGQPAISTTLNCALHAADGQFRAALCGQAQRHACARRSNLDADAYLERQWVIAETAGPWMAGASACPSGYAFDVPRNGFDNELLKLAKQAAGVSEVWLNYNDNGGDGSWVAAP